MKRTDRPHEWMKFCGYRTILEVAQALHEANTGSSEMHPDDQTAHRRVIKSWLDSWNPPNVAWDDVVKKLLNMALKEGEPKARLEYAREATWGVIGMEPSVVDLKLQDEVRETDPKRFLGVPKDSMIQILELAQKRGIDVAKAIDDVKASPHGQTYTVEASGSIAGEIESVLTGKGRAMERDTVRLAEQALIEAAMRLEEDWQNVRGDGPPPAAGLIAAVMERASYLRGVRKSEPTKTRGEQLANSLIRVGQNPGERHRVYVDQQPIYCLTSNHAAEAEKILRKCFSATVDREISEEHKRCEKDPG